MIRRILVVGQGPNDIGFLRGLRDRLECHAELIDYSSGRALLRQRGHFIRKQDAKLIWSTHSNVDLIVRITDGDTEHPRDARREELSRWPDDAQAILVCGVCDRDIEHWVCLAPRYAAEQLGFSPEQIPGNRKDLSGFIKGRIASTLGSGRDYTTFLADFVKNAPPAVFKHWLSNPAFSAFHDECRAAAKRHSCTVRNLRDNEEAA